MEQFIFEENLSILDEDRDGAGEEADIEALLLPSEPRAPSPSIAPSDLPRAPPHQQGQIKPIARLESSQSMNSTSNSQGAQIAGLPPDIAAILDMVTISGTQEPQHQQSATTPSSPVNEPIKLPSDDAGLLPAAISAQAAGSDPADETSDSSSSDWDSSASSESEEDEAEDRPNKQTRPPPRPKLGDSDDDDEVGGRTHSAPLKTANEVVDPNVAPPSIEKVGDDERLEIIGEVMSIIGSVVVVKGLPGSAAEKVLDTGSLLVWDDRHVFGEVFETFGPTHLPLYSIRLPSSPSSSVFTVGRKVYHIPTRSNYVFTRSLAFIRGSDASNQHDEEVGEDEIEFSDDEKETEWKRQRKMKRQTSVRPSPSVRDDGDWEYSSSSAYHDPGAAVGGSSGVTAGPSTPRRAPPAPYDESMDLPYEDQEVSTQDDDAMSVSSSLPETNYNRGRGFSRGRGGRGRGARDRGRGRGRGGRGGFRGGMPPPSNPSINRHHDNPPPQFGGTSTDEYDPRTSNSEGFGFSFSQPSQQSFGFANPGMDMGMGMMPNFGGGSSGGPVTHFNPNFFPGMMMGMNMGGFGPMGMGWNFGGAMGGQGDMGYWPGHEGEEQNGPGRGSGYGEDGGPR